MMVVRSTLQVRWTCITELLPFFSDCGSALKCFFGPFDDNGTQRRQHALAAVGQGHTYNRSAYRNCPVWIALAKESRSGFDPVNIPSGIRGPYATMFT